MSGHTQPPQHWLDNLTCKSRVNPDQWDPKNDEFHLFFEAIRTHWDNLDRHTYFAHIALMRMGHRPRTPFFIHMYGKLRGFEKLRGISKEELFANLPLQHLERVKAHFNTDEILSLAIQKESNEWAHNNQVLHLSASLAQAAQVPGFEGQPANRPARDAGAPRSPASSSRAPEGSVADARPSLAPGNAPDADTRRSSASSTASEASAAGAADTGAQTLQSKKRKVSSGRDNGDPKRSRLEGTGEGQHEHDAEGGRRQEAAAEKVGTGARAEKTSSIFIYDDDSDVL